MEKKLMLDAKRVVVVHLNNILLCPPVIQLVDNLLSNGHVVYLVSSHITELPERLLGHPCLQYTDIPRPNGNSLTDKLCRWKIRSKISKATVKRYMEKGDILWTTTDLCVRTLGRLVFGYRHVMQLMELEEWYPMFGNTRWLRFPIGKYAKRAWKTVVPEVNRAYIQKTWWNLDRTPCVLPNKPYRLDPGEVSQDMQAALDKIKNEKRKVIIFLGLFSMDRRLDEFANAVERLGDEYCLYMVGKPIDKYKKEFARLLKSCPSIQYLGYYPAPKHLLFLKYAHIGLLPYIPFVTMVCRSPLNALYCAPNKIFEYAGYGIPMIGTDVMGLRLPFEQYRIGVCCKQLTADAIGEAISEIEKNYDEMSANCKRFYDSVDLDQIVEKILYEA